jgi:hypothetical protein
MVSKGNHPQMAARFRLVKYYNLPRFDPPFFQTNPYEQCSEPLLVDTGDYHDIHNDHNALLESLNEIG